MAGKFVNTEIKNTVENLTTGVINRVNNNYYHYNELASTIVTYFNFDPNKSTFDESLGIEYSMLGKNSPFVYNKIYNYIIYGLSVADMNTEITDFGLQSAEINGRALILPNTIEPHTGDFFIINYLKEPLLFKVINAESNRLDNGSISYEIEYTLGGTNNSVIEDNVEEEFEYILQNVGTSYNPIIQKKVYNLIDEIDTSLLKLRKLYKELFFNERVDTFILNKNGIRIYDDFLLSFIMDSHIMSSNQDDYLYLDYKIPVQKDFKFKYNRSFYRYLIDRDKDNIDKCLTFALLESIEIKDSVFYFRMEPYYSTSYQIKKMEFDVVGIIQSIVSYPIELLSDIKMSNSQSNDILSNIIVKYFNNEEISIKDINKIEDTLYDAEEYKLFYYIPVVIYCLEYYIKHLMKK